MTKTIFIVGAPRSGTSLLLYMLVRNQPEVSGSNFESKFYAIANKRTFEKHTFLNDEYFGSLLSEAEINSLFDKSFNARDFFKNVIQYKTAKESSSCFVEKSPIHALFYKKILADFDNVSFILIYRNAAANIHSIATTKWIDLFCDKFPDRLRNNKSIRYFFAITHYYKYWATCKEIEKLKETVLTLQYEDIVLEKSAIKESLENVIGKELSPLFIARPFSSEVVHKNSGFDKSRVDDYQQKMPLRIQKIIKMIFNPSNAKEYIIRFCFIYFWLAPTRCLAKLTNR